MKQLKGHASCAKRCPKNQMGTGNDEARKVMEMKDIMKPPEEEDNHLSLRRKRKISEMTSRKTTLGFALVLDFVTFAVPVSTCHTSKELRTNCWLQLTF